MADLKLTVDVLVKGSNQLRNLGSDLRSTGRGLTVGVTAPLIAAGAGFAKLAADAQKSQTRLESVFKTTGAAAWTSVEALNAHAEALSQSTTFDDDAVKDAQASLLRFGTIAGEQFTGATEAAADLAAFMETDISTAAEQLGKALADPEAGITRLTRAGIILSEQQKTMVRDLAAAGETAAAQQVILDALAGSIGNVAEDIAATDSGKFTQAMNELGEAGEAAGVILLPLFTGLANGLKSIAQWFQNLDPAMQQVVVGFAALAAAAGPVLFVAGSLIGSFKQVGGAFTALTTLLKANPYLALIGATVALVTLVAMNWDAIVETVTTAVSRILRFLANAIDTVATIGAKIWQPIGTGFGAAIDFIRGVWNAFVRFWNGIQISVPAIDVPFLGRVGGFSVGLPDLPYLAEGGIVNQPTLAVIGERGPEAVVPLDKMGAHETHIHLTYAGEMPEDEDDLVALLRQVAPFVDGRLRVAD